MNWRSAVVCLVFAVAALPAEGGLTECLSRGGVGEVAQPGSDSWNKALRLQGGWQDTESEPAAVVLPSSAQEVSQAIKCAREHGTPVTARCGSHGNAGVSVMPGAVTLDLRRMDTVWVSDDGSRAYIGGGARLGHVYYEIGTATNGTKGFPAGSCPGVGAGGHIQGGGQGNLIRAYGQACVRSCSVEVVDAQGRVLRANRTHHPDLFWATCGGGGGNFGIVTEYEVEPVDVPPVVTTITISAAGKEQAADLADWFVSTLSPGLPNTWSPFMIWGGNGTAIVGINLGDEAATRALLEAQGLDKAPAGTQVELKEMSWLESTVPSGGDLYPNITSVDQLPDWETYDKTAVFKSKVKSFYLNDFGPLPKGAHSALLDFLQQTPGATAYFQLMGEAANELAPDATANPWTRQAFAVTLEVAWDEGKEPPSGAFDALSAVEARMAESLPEVLTTGYINYLDIDLDRWQALARYHGPNAPRLVAVKAKYDPGNFFNNPWSVPLTLEPPSEAAVAEDDQEVEREQLAAGEDADAA